MNAVAIAARSEDTRRAIMRVVRCWVVNAVRVWEDGVVRICEIAIMAPFLAFEME